MLDFISIRFLDIIDILLVAVLLYQIYRMIKGTVAFNIVIGFFLVYFIWLIVQALGMELTSNFIGQFIGVGVIALIIIFHPEIRRFLLYIGSRNHISKLLSFDKLFQSGEEMADSRTIEILADTLSYFSRTLTGALIVITRKSELTEQINSGETINARISQPLLKTIFFKNTPLHDGAVIISNDQIVAAGCILPLTHKEIDKSMGLRHRAAIGVTEISDAVVLVVSEETGNISLIVSDRIERGLDAETLTALLKYYLTSTDKPKEKKENEDE